MMNYYNQVATQKGGPEVLSWQMQEQQPPGEGEISVKVEAAGVLLADVLWQMGITPIGPKPPFVPGYDLVGIVAEVGKNVTGFEPGQRIAALVQYGGYTEYAVIPAEKAVVVPPGLPPAEVAAVITSYLTAYMILKTESKLNPDSVVLVHGAGGGTGIALVELAKLFGYRVYGTASEGKHALIREKGGIPIDYRNVNFEEIINAAEPEGVDLIIDPIGGDVTTRSLKLLRKGGQLISTAMIGSMQGQGLPIPLQLIRMSLWSMRTPGKKAFFWDVVAAANKDGQQYQENLAAVINLLELGKIKPEIAKLMPLNNASEAQDLLLNYAVQGKIVLTTSKT